MATLDDKLMGEKLHYYCSSSSDEEDDQPRLVQPEGGAEATGQPGPSYHTGPKGVVEDWRRYKQLESERREAQEVERLELAKKLSLTCRSEREEREAAEKEREIDEELDAMLDDEFIRDFREKRMREMLEAASGRFNFGRVINLSTGDEFLAAVDDVSHKTVTTIVHIWELGGPGCHALDSCFAVLAKDHPSVKFCRFQASSCASLSKMFKVSGVPAIVVYRGGDVTNTFVRITNELGDEFYASDLESYLVEHGVLADHATRPKNIRGPSIGSSSDSD